MPDSPYAPPLARLDDIPSTAPLPERPRQVALALKCIITGLVIETVDGVWNVFQPSTEEWAPLMIGAATVLELVIVLAVCFGVTKGRNWGRYLYLAIILLSLFAMPGTPFFEGTDDATTGPHQLVVDLVTEGLGIFAIYLLFTRVAREWFRGMKGRG
jgi:hypothetical protein